MSMQFQTRFCDIFGVENPIILAAMAGNINSAELVAAVSESGGLGTIAGAYVTPQALRERIREVRSLTNRPFAVNLLLFEQPEQQEVTPAFRQWLNQQRERFNLPPWKGDWPTLHDEITDCFTVILEEKPAVFSCAMGLPGKYGESAKAAGMKVVGMATTQAEAERLVSQHVDAIVAQGGEAGGHRGTFDAGEDGPGECIGTLPLVAQLSAAIREVPIIAAGGIMNGQSIVAALALGAEAVQLGTRFLGCAESTANKAYKERLIHAKETDTAVTRAFSGRPARGIVNQFMRDFAKSQIGSLAYPVQNELTKEIRQAAGKALDADYLSLWAGQGVGMLQKEEAAADIMHALLQEAQQSFNRLQGQMHVK
ncbi:nitronate monooxygenase [Brevibacillus laterosporus]|uniref:Probable nitronate monooxygenase n=1 Tax=Brevibacillus laterosporus LMG 15441 TaxID=1042163 RepID=A0A075QWH4_BRELA|nr:nitronate monooxygenase [Brevibacillus laterosporus]AIG24762.1 nitronate monooxygenase [Brevibacillus laterosporus LMG 15441]RJL07884.1 nitronate monooxygenase [Brevibacillus laterosporus]TPH12957.1 nitronate monooxygenase [Brevibacillus laterosporus]HAS01342.1 nitronate monooxygenase [Brevibacillus sp.]